MTCCRKQMIFPPAACNLLQRVCCVLSNWTTKKPTILNRITPNAKARIRDKRPEHQEVANLNRSKADYQYIVVDHPPVVLPKRPDLKPRGNPLNKTIFIQSMDDKGRIIDEKHIKNIISHGGCENSSIRREVWKYLLGYYPWNSTREQRTHIGEQQKFAYERMKVQWMNKTPDQISRFNVYRRHKSLVGIDVHRTDRTQKFYAGEGNENLVKLHNVLMTYVMYNFDLGYVQGMSDLLSPILMTMDGDEVESFWCFVGFMNRVSTNFELEQTGIKKQLNNLYYLLTIVSPALANYLKKTDSSNMCFCFRWLLVLFKRELTDSDTMRLWEVLWTDVPCENFHLLICVSILDSEKNKIIYENYDSDKILKLVNNLSKQIDLNKVLTKAYSIYEQLKEAQSSLQNSARILLGFPISD